MSQYYIYQTDAEYAFQRWERAKKVFSFKDYEKFYSGELVDFIAYKDETITCNTNDSEILDKLFCKFNTAIPDGFTGHSLSVSDVVEIVRKSGKRYYYCDASGWQQIQIDI